MTIESAQTPPQRELPVGVVMLSLIAVLAIIGFIGYRIYLAPPPENPIQRQSEETLDRLAKKSGGDVSRLSKDELAEANKLTSGRADAALKNVAETKGYVMK